jgi:hypothetical protein
MRVLRGATDAAWGRRHDGGRRRQRAVASGNGADVIISTGRDRRQLARGCGIAGRFRGGQRRCAALAQSTAVSSATAIDTGDGHDADQVSNTGALTAQADALALSAAVSVTTAGLAVGGNSVWDGGTKSDAAARGMRSAGARIA